MNEQDYPDRSGPGGQEQQKHPHADDIQTEFYESTMAALFLDHRRRRAWPPTAEGGTVRRRSINMTGPP